MDVIVTVSFIMCFFGLFEFITHISLFTPFYSGVATDLNPTLQSRGIFARSETSFGHAITFGIYIGFCSLIDTLLFFITKKKKYVFFLIVLVVTLFSTVSRAPIIIFVISEMIMLYLFGFTKLIKTIIKVSFILASGVLVLSLVFPSVFLSVQTIFNMVMGVFSSEFAESAGDYQNADAFLYRVELMRVLPSLISNNWLIGMGSALNFRFYMLGHYYRSIDNAYLLWILRCGVVGLAGFIIYQINIIINSFKVKSHSQISRYLWPISLFYLLNRTRPIIPHQAKLRKPC